jgi:ferredoxin-NADP reductase
VIAGGSGLVPLMAMLRHCAANSSTVEARLLLSARSLDDTLYRDELAELTGDGLVTHFTFTREPRPDWREFALRIDAEMLRTVGPSRHQRPRIYACGATAFVEGAAELLVQLGHQPRAIRTERFGPSG